MIIDQYANSIMILNDDKVATKYGYQIELDAWAIIIKIPCGKFSSDRIGEELIAPLAEKLDKQAEAENHSYHSEHDPR